MSDTKSRIAELKAERARLAAAREARLNAEREEAELAALERSVRDDKAIDEAERTIGKQGEKIAVVQTIHGAVIFKRADDAVWRRFVDLQELKIDEVERLVRSCVHYPTDRFDAILADQPGILIECADAIAYIMGVRDRNRAKKAVS